MFRHPFVMRGSSAGLGYRVERGDPRCCKRDTRYHSGILHIWRTSLPNLAAGYVS